jgi:hypothetical protein
MGNGHTILQSNANQPIFQRAVIIVMNLQSDRADAMVCGF